MHDWEAIREQHGRLVWNAIGKILRNPEDITDCYQEVFLEAFERSQRGEIHNLPGFLRWLAVHRALDSIRKTKSRRDYDVGFDITNLVCTSSQNDLRLRELLDSVRGELASLSSDQSDAFWLCCVEGLKYHEAAEVMELSTQHVGMLVHRARKHLSRTLVDWGSTRAT